MTRRAIPRVVGRLVRSCVVAFLTATVCLVFIAFTAQGATARSLAPIPAKTLEAERNEVAKRLHNAGYKAIVTGGPGVLSDAPTCYSIEARHGIYGYDLRLCPTPSAVQSFEKLEGGPSNVRVIGTHTYFIVKTHGASIDGVVTSNPALLSAFVRDVGLDHL